MHIPMKAQAAIIFFVIILIGSATLLRSVSDPNQLHSPQELNDSNVASALNNSSLFILDFYYPGCGPCKFVNNTTSELSRELQGQARFGRMNVREKESSQTVKKYKISAYPTLLFFDEGILVNRIKGNISKSDLLAAIKDLRPDLDASKVKIVQAAAPTKASPEPLLTPGQACANETKSDKPLLEAFIVSRCPFGLQMQRIMAGRSASCPRPGTISWSGT